MKISIRNLVSTLALVLALFVLTGVTASAQCQPGTLTTVGYVTDSNNGGVDSIEVRAVWGFNIQTTTTDSNGFYSFTGLPACTNITYSPNDQNQNNSGAYTAEASPNYLTFGANSNDGTVHGNTNFQMIYCGNGQNRYIGTTLYDYNGGGTPQPMAYIYMVAESPQTAYGSAQAQFSTATDLTGAATLTSLAGCTYYRINPHIQSTGTNWVDPAYYIVNSGNVSGTYSFIHHAN